jgi:DNA-binding MarR family transcriptional regulator
MPTHDRSQATATPPLAGYTGYLLRRAFARARDCAQQVLPPGTHPGEGAILTRLAEGGPASQQELSGRLHVNRTIMVKLVDRLEAAGLVRRERNTADRRCYALVVTPRGSRRSTRGGRPPTRASGSWWRRSAPVSTGA